MARRMVTPNTLLLTTRGDYMNFMFQKIKNHTSSSSLFCSVTDMLRKKKISENNMSKFWTSSLLCRISHRKIYKIYEFQRTFYWCSVTKSGGCTSYDVYVGWENSFGEQRESRNVQECFSFQYVLFKVYQIIVIYSHPH